MSGDDEKSSIKSAAELSDSDDTEKGEKREERAGDFRVKQLDIGRIENSVYREKWWQIW